jgi:hypothetical protein
METSHFRVYGSRKSLPPPCSFGLSAANQQYFSLRTNQQPTNSTFLSEQISTSHQPNEQAAREEVVVYLSVCPHAASTGTGSRRGSPRRPRRRGRQRAHDQHAPKAPRRHRRRGRRSDGRAELLWWRGLRRGADRADGVRTATTFVRGCEPVPRRRTAAAVGRRREGNRQGEPTPRRANVRKFWSK